MIYYKLQNYNETTYVKINKKIINIVNRMAVLVNKHANLDRELVKEFAKINKISEDEACDIMDSSNFLVDDSQYGITSLEHEQITKEEYNNAISQQKTII